MLRAPRAALAALALLLAACASATEIPSPSTSVVPSATAEAAEVCVGANGQDLDIDEPARTYGLAWNEPDDSARHALVTDIVTEDITWAEPSLADRISGAQAVTDRIGDFHDGRPGEYFEWQTSDLPEMHHERLRMPWRLCDAEGATLLEGTDFAALTADGRIADIASFHPAE